MTFDFSDFSKYRTQLMGISILAIMLFHANFLKCGWIGVEFFLLISSIGLFFSLSKDQRLIPFYKKRFIRILPAYLLVALPYFAYHNRDGFEIGNYLSDLIGLHIFHSEYYFWFVNLIIICYLIAPFYFKSLKYKYSIILPFITLVICFFLGLYFKPLEILLNRFAIFFLGFHLAQLVYEKKQIHFKYLAPICFIVILLVYAIGEVREMGEVNMDYIRSIKKVFYFFLSIPALMGFIILLKKSPQFINRFLIFLGGITLEIYMVHERICFKTLKMFFNSFDAGIISLPLAILAAYLLHKLVEYITQKLHTNLLAKSN